MSKNKPMYIWFRFVRVCSRIFCRLFFTMRAYGVENIPENGPCLLVSNHQSFLDPLFCGNPLKRPLHFLARHTLFKNKLFGWLISSINTTPVKRGQADLAAMKTVIKKLRAEQVVCIFPEATRTADGKIIALKPGMALLCRRSNASIVPVVIDGAFEAWPRHKKIFSPWHKITVCYGDCITIEQIRKLSDRELAENLTNTLRRMQDDCRIKEGKEPYNY